MEKKYTVLIVDDDKFLLDMYRNKFVSGGHTVTVAVGSTEALTTLRGGADPNILILDIIMPEMDGIELLGVVRKEKLAPHAIVVMLTNESSPDVIEKAKALGIEGYIVKAASVPSEVVEETLKIANAKIK